MKEIESNKEAWGKIAEDHYRAFKQALENGTHRLNLYIQEELGDITAKSVIHLQCNTGADTILLARKAAHVTGVDLVPENVCFAYKMVRELGIGNVDFIESDIMTLSEIHREKYDVVFTSEGVLGWLPDLRIWARTIRQLLKDDGFVYVFDSHPFALTFDEEKLSRQEFDIRYPYFSDRPDEDDSVGGYVSEAKQGVKAYFWMHTISDIVNSLSEAGFHLEFFNEFPETFYDAGGMQPAGKAGLYSYGYNMDKFPMSFSLKATVMPGC